MPAPGSWVAALALALLLRPYSPAVGQSSDCIRINGLCPVVAAARTCSGWAPGDFTGRSATSVGGVFSLQACENYAKGRFPTVNQIAVRLADGTCTLKDPDDTAVSPRPGGASGGWQSCTMPPLLVARQDVALAALDRLPVVDTENIIRSYFPPMMLRTLSQSHHAGYSFDELVNSGFYCEYVDAGDEDGWTSAHWAVYFGKPEHLAILMQAGANLSKATVASKVFDRDHTRIGAHKPRYMSNSPVVRRSICLSRTLSGVL
eukprot:SAG25_NODE_2883_length_1335_cov_1.073625_1_plen_261_part_00